MQRSPATVVFVLALTVAGLLPWLWLGGLPVSILALSSSLVLAAGALLSPALLRRDWTCPRYLLLTALVLCLALIGLQSLAVATRIVGYDTGYDHGVFIMAAVSIANRGDFWVSLFPTGPASLLTEEFSPFVAVIGLLAKYLPVLGGNYGINAHHYFMLLQLVCLAVLLTVLIAVGRSQRRSPLITLAAMLILLLTPHVRHHLNLHVRPEVLALPALALAYAAVIHRRAVLFACAIAICLLFHASLAFAAAGMVMLWRSQTETGRGRIYAIVMLFGVVAYFMGQAIFWPSTATALHSFELLTTWRGLQNIVIVFALSIPVLALGLAWLPNFSPQSLRSYGTHSMATLLAMLPLVADEFQPGWMWTSPGLIAPLFLSIMAGLTVPADDPAEAEQTEGVEEEQIAPPIVVPGWRLWAMALLASLMLSFGDDRPLPVVQRNLTNTYDLPIEMLNWPQEAVIVTSDGLIPYLATNHLLTVDADPNWGVPATNAIILRGDQSKLHAATMHVMQDCGDTERDRWLLLCRPN